MFIRNIWCICISVLVFCTTRVPATIINVDNASALQAALKRALDGDEVVLAPGIYPGRFAARGLTGVIVRSADVVNPAVIDADSFGEGIKLESAKRVTLADLIIERASENGINIDDSGFLTPSSHIIIHNVQVRNGGGHGIKFAGVDTFLIDQVQVVDWGIGFAGINLIGAHDGLVVNSLLRHTSPQGFGIKVEAGSTNVTIRANRFDNAGERAIQFGGSVRSFRPPNPPSSPNIPEGTVTVLDIVAEGNVIVFPGNDSSGIRAGVAFIGTDGSIFRNNIIVRPAVFVMRILKENNDPGFIDTQNGKFIDNIILWEQGDLFRAVNAGPNTLPESFVFARNQWFNRTNPSNSMLSLPAQEHDGIYGVDPGISVDTVIPWQFAWGIWVVNTTEEEQTYVIEPSQSYTLAQPGEDAQLDIASDNPLVGEWTLTPLASPMLSVEAFSYAVLIATQ